MAEDKQFFVGQKAFINKNGALLVLKDRIGLDFPGGKIQEGETDFIASLKREVTEETTLEIKIGEPFTTWYFEFGPNHRNAGKQVFLVGYKCEYESGEVTLSDEHHEYRWITKEEIDTVRENSTYFQALKKYFELE